MALLVWDPEDFVLQLGLGHLELHNVGKMYRVKTRIPAADYGTMGGNSAVALASKLADRGATGITVEESP